MRLRVAMGEVCREARHQRGLTMREVSSKASVSLGHLSEIERGLKEGSSELWDSIAFGLGMTLSEIVIEAGWRMSPIPDTAEALDNYPSLVVR